MKDARTLANREMATIELVVSVTEDNKIIGYIVKSLDGRMGLMSNSEVFSLALHNRVLNIGLSGSRLVGINGYKLSNLKSTANPSEYLKRNVMSSITDMPIYMDIDNKVLTYNSKLEKITLENLVEAHSKLQWYPVIAVTVDKEQTEEMNRFKPDKAWYRMFLCSDLGKIADVQCTGRKGLSNVLYREMGNLVSSKTKIEYITDLAQDLGAITQVIDKDTVEMYGCTFRIGSIYSLKNVRKLIDYIEMVMLFKR